MRWLGLFRNKTFRKHLELIFPLWDFIICIVSLEISVSSPFCHPHSSIRIFSILILSSAFLHPHFIIRIFLSAIRHHPGRSSLYRDPIEEAIFVTSASIFSETVRGMKLKFGEAIEKKLIYQDPSPFR